MSLNFGYTNVKTIMLDRNSFEAVTWREMYQSSDDGKKVYSESALTKIYKSE